MDEFKAGHTYRVLNYRTLMKKATYVDYGDCLFYKQNSQPFTPDMDKLAGCTISVCVPLVEIVLQQYIIQPWMCEEVLPQ